MEAMENIYTRRSVRAYADRPVTRKTLDRVLSAALMAPSWKNTQTAGYLVIQTPEMKEKLMECLPAYNARTVSTAPVVVVMTTRKSRCGYERDGSYSTKKGDRWEMFDAGIAAMTFSLAAYDKGVGSCIMGVFDDAKVAETIGLEAGKTVAALIPIGFPKFTPDATPRKETAELITYMDK